jgi:cytochrome b561
MTAQIYTRTAVVLHWLIGIAVLAQITLGLWMITIPKSPPGAPPLPTSMPSWERTAARLNHALLYVCMLVMPVSGYLGSSFTKYPILYFGTRLPHWGWDSPALKELCSQVHYWTVMLFITLIAIHIGAAAKHWLVDRDGVVARMWFARE